MKRNTLLLILATLALVAMQCTKTSAIDDDGPSALQALLNKRIDMMISKGVAESMTVGKEEGYKLLSKRPQAILKQDRDDLLACAAELYNQGKGRDYSIDTMSGWIESAWIEYREEVGVAEAIDRKMFLSLADELALVEVSSQPDQARVTVGRTRFRKKTNSKGFVRVEGTGKTRIHVEKDGYDAIDETVTLDPKAKNEFSYKLVPQ